MKGNNCTNCKHGYEIEEHVWLCDRDAKERDHDEDTCFEPKDVPDTPLTEVSAPLNNDGRSECT